MSEIEGIGALVEDALRTAQVIRVAGTHRRQVAAKWLELGLSTEPADRTAAEEAVKRIYTSVGLRLPREIVWQTSPSSGLAFAISRVNGNGQLAGPLPENVCGMIMENVLGDARSRIAAKVGRGTFDNLRSYFEWELRTVATVRGAIRGVLSYDERRCGYGGLAADWLAPYDLCRRLLKPPISLAVDAILDIAASSGWWWPFVDFCVFTERPRVISHDFEHHHAGSGGRELDVLIKYTDGWGVGLWNGVRVPLDVVTRPESLTVERIRRERNIEVRRVMMERYGMQRLLNDGGASLVHRDDHGELYRLTLGDGDPRLVLKVRNATASQDGSFKDFLLRVPPRMKTARQAVAWTFDFENPEDYHPEVET